MGRKALLALLCCVAAAKGAENSVNSSAVSDNVSAESAPRLYPEGYHVYASGVPYSLTFRSQGPATSASQVIPVKEESVFIQNQNGFLKDSYGNQYKVGSPHAVGYKTTFPQQFVRLQDLPVHLSQPLASGFKLDGKEPQFSYKAPTFRFSTLSVTVPPLTKSQLIPRQYATNVKSVSPLKGRYSVPQRSPQQQSSNSKAVYASQHHTGYIPQQGSKFQRLEDLRPHGFKLTQGSGNLHNNKVIHSNKENLLQALQSGSQSAPAKQVTVLTYCNGNVCKGKETVTLETKPPLPLLDLNLLQPLHFENPIVPQVQHYLPRINYPIPQVEQKKHHNEFVVQKTKSYDTGYVPHSNDDDEEEEQDDDESPPPPKQSKKPIQTPNEKPPVIVKGNRGSPEYSYEINSPNYKESYNEQVVKYDKKKDDVPVNYSYDQKTENKPVSYSFTKTSKAPVIDKHVSYEVHGTGPKQKIIVHSTPESKHHQHLEKHHHHSPQSHHQESHHHQHSRGNKPGDRHHGSRANQGDQNPRTHSGERHHPPPQTHHQGDHTHYQPQDNHNGNHKHSNQQSGHRQSPRHQQPHSESEQETSEYSDESQSEESGEQSPRDDSGEGERDDDEIPSHQLKAEHRDYHNPHGAPQYNAPHHNNLHNQPVSNFRNHNNGPHPSVPHHNLPHHNGFHNNNSPPHNTPNQNHNVPHHIISNVKNQYGFLHNSPPPQFHPSHHPVTTIQSIIPQYHDENLRFLSPAKHQNGQIKAEHPHHQHNIPAEHNQQNPGPVYHDGFNSPIQVLAQVPQSSPAPQIHFTTLQAPTQHQSAPQTQHQFEWSHAPQQEHQQRPSPTPKTYYGTNPHIIEKSRKIIIQEETPEEMHVHSDSEEMIAQMIHPENEEDFEKAYKEAAFGFPAYERDTQQLEKDIYNPESYGEPRYGDIDVENSPFQQYQEEGDKFPKSARSNYKDDNENVKEDYFLDYSVHKPESYLDMHKNKVNYYKMYKKQRPEYLYEDEPENKQRKSEKLTSDLFGFNSYQNPKQASYFAQLQHAPEYDYTKEAPKDSFAFASSGPSKSKTLFVEPQFQYGFEPSSLPSLLDSELAAMASNNSPESEKPGTRKKIYKETFHIRQTSTGGDPAS